MRFASFLSDTKIEALSRPTVIAINVEKDVKVNRDGGGYITVVDVSRLMPIELCKSRVDTWIRTIKRSRLVKVAEEILLPGERAQENEERCLTDGVEIREEYCENLERNAVDLGVDIQTLR